MKGSVEVVQEVMKEIKNRSEERKNMEGGK